jgi:hypothetical protein
MSVRLQSFPSRKNSTLNVFCPDEKTVITSFENYLPNSGDVSKLLSDTQPSIPARLCWLKENYDYYAYLPKERLFDGHLLAPLKHDKPTLIQRDGRWFLDDGTRELWRSLDNNLTKSINVVGRGMLVDLEHCEPSRAIRFGFTNGHRTEKNLRVSLRMSRSAFLHRLAYLTYVVSLRHRWDQDLADQVWWKDLGTMCGPTWVDSVWDTIYKQWEARDFIGVVIKPVSSSIRWLRSALSFGVPIWVWYPAPHIYDQLDGSFVIKHWKPTGDQVAESRQAAKALIAAQAFGSATTPPLSDHQINPFPETHANLTPEPLVRQNSPSPPAELPQGASWHQSWEAYFQKREQDDRESLRVASKTDKMVWNSRAKNAEGFGCPGRQSGTAVYVWESCDTGGFFRIKQTRHDALRDWDSYYREALIFNPKQNTWDYCTFMWKPAVEDGPPDDLDDDDENRHIMEHWYIDPAPPANLPEDNPPSLCFLYRRYGYLSIEPTTPPNPILPLDKSSAYRIVGLEVQNAGEYPEHINCFLTDVLQRRLPAGHCDLSPSSPPNEAFPSSSRTLIRDAVFFSEFPELSESMVFTFVSSANDSHLLVLHDSLSVLEVMRARTPLQLKAQLEYLLLNGSRFTLLYPKARPLVSPHWNILPFPIRDAMWKPNIEDFRAYMSRLKTFFLERPYIAAAAFSRGGIAWRIAQEALGLDGSIDTLLVAYPDQSSSVSTRRGQYWFHELDEGEWFYLVGGYETLTGL